MKSRFIGGILLIVGTSIGGGMLALPIANAATGFWQSSLFLLICWAAMTLGALFILEVNLYLPAGKHMVSMADATLGPVGLLTAWISYLFLLYTLLSAYISGGADVMSGLFKGMGIALTTGQSSTLFTVFFGCIVYGGIRNVDLLNRGLMFGKLAIYVILIVLIAPFIHVGNFIPGQAAAIASSVMILITSFGFAIIVPNLREYFNDDIKKLRKVVFIGSFIPLICYLAWDAVIMGSLSTDVANSLAGLMQAEQPTTELAGMIAATIDSRFINTFFNAFTSICMLTAFLGVSLCLISFLSDGFKMEQKGREGLGLFLMTFTPPLLIVLFYPGAYLAALRYAGIFCVILLLLLPALMAFFGRKRYNPVYLVPGGNISIVLVIGFSLLLLVNAAIQL